MMWPAAADGQETVDQPGGTPAGWAPLSPRRYLLISIGYLLLYLLVFRGAIIYTTPQGVIPWYPPAGLNLALLLILGIRFAPVVFVANILGAFMRGIPFDLPSVLIFDSVLVSVGYSMAALLLGRWFRIDLRLRRLRDVLSFLLVAVLIPVIVAFLAISIRLLSGVTSPAEAGLALFEWWAGDATGIMTITALFLVAPISLATLVFRPPAESDSQKSTPEVLPFAELLLWLLVTIGLLLLSLLNPLLDRFHLLYLLFLPLFWLGLRYGIRGAIIASFFIVSGTMTFFGLHGERLLIIPDIQLFMLVLCITALIIGGVINERRETLSSIKRSETWFRQIVTTSEEGILVLDTEFCINYCNERMQQMLGYSVDELLGHSLLEFMDKEDREAALGCLRRRLQGGEEDYDFRFCRKDGSHIWVILSSSPINDAQGELTGVLGMLTDITSRKQADAALRESEEKYRILYLNMNEGMAIDELVFNEQGEPVDWIITDVNPAYQHLLRRPEEAFVHKNASQIFGEERVLPVVQRIAKAILQGESIRFEYRPEGSARSFIISAFPLGDHRFATLTSDITEQLAALAALEQERAFASSGIELLPFPIIFNSTEGEVFRANQASYRFFDNPNPVEWWNIRLLQPDTHHDIPRDEWPMIRSLHGEILSGKEGIIAFDSREVPVLVHSAPVYVQGELVASVVAFQDISEIKAADQAKIQFLGILSHELKTPLTSILGWTQAAEDAPELREEALKIVERNAQELRWILSDLIDVSRLLHGRLVVKPVPVDLWALVMEVVGRMQPMLEQHELKLILQPPPAGLPVQAEPGRMRQVFHNLLENAIKFSPPGATITVSGTRDDRTATVSISDTGRGIAPESLRTLFEPFRQIERTEQTGGLGLGLILVRGIVELQGGRVTAFSPGLEQGSTFTVMLPIAES